MEKLLSLEEVADRYGVSIRSARKIIGEAGITKIMNRVFVREAALSAYEADRTVSTYLPKRKVRG